MPRYFHVTSSLNRESIEQYGLDWTRMALAPGIAGAPRPEVTGIYVCDDEWEAEYFAEMGTSHHHAAVDVWEIRIDSETDLIEDESGGYRYLPAPIPRDQIRLVRRAWVPTTEPE